MAPRAEAKTVLFDNSHGERFLLDGKGPLQLSGFAEVLKASGATTVVGDKPFSDESLKGVDALVISGAFAPLAPHEIEAVVRFLLRGGKPAVMLHIAPPMQTLLERLDVTYTNGVIRERENVIDGEAINFRVNRIAEHPVFKGLSGFNLYGVWGLMNRGDGARVVAATSPKAWVDIDRSGVRREEATASFGVAVAGAVGNGGFIVFGDDAIFQNKFLQNDNRTLAANLAAWL